VVRSSAEMYIIRDKVLHRHPRSIQFPDSATKVSWTRYSESPRMERNVLEHKESILLVHPHEFSGVRQPGDTQGPGHPPHGLALLGCVSWTQGGEYVAVVIAKTAASLSTSDRSRRTTGLAAGPASGDGGKQLVPNCREHRTSRIISVILAINYFVQINLSSLYKRVYFLFKPIQHQHTMLIITY